MKKPGTDICPSPSPRIHSSLLTPAAACVAPRYSYALKECTHTTRRLNRNVIQ